MTDDEAALRVRELVERIGVLLHGEGPEVQSATLADLTSMWIAGHFVADNPAETARYRGKLLRRHMQLVRDLIRPNEQMILERVRKESH